MAQRPVIEYPDPRLLEPCAQVDHFDDDVSTLVEDLTDTLQGSTGIALSAPQLGDLRQVLVMDLSAQRDSPEIYINPLILSRRRPGLVEESCLSLPGVVGNVLRSTEVRVRAQDVHGEVFERDLSGMHAVALQHEMDHFEGRLFIERLSRFRRWRLRRAGYL